MKRLVILTVTLICLGALPSWASANKFTGATIDVGESHATIVLQAEEPADEPRIGTRPGLVKAWFPRMSHNSLRVEGDGELFRYVRIRPGANDTSLVIVRLSDRRSLERSDVQISQEGSEVRLSIPLSALPGAPATQEAAADAEAETSEEAEGAVAATDEEATEEAEPLGQPTEEETVAGATLTSGQGANMGLMLLVTLLLGFIYMMVRIFTKKKGATSPMSDIEIIANKRLGAKHQLVVVRALGEDHLLSINAGRTDRIASLPTPESAYAEPSEAPAEAAETPSIFQRIQSGLGVGSQRPTEPAGEMGEERVSLSQAAQTAAFGTELRRASGGPRPHSSIPAAQAARGGASEAVAGLIRLRERSAR